MNRSLGIVAHVLGYRMKMWPRWFRSNRGLRRLGPVFGALLYLVYAGLIALMGFAVTANVHRVSPQHEQALLILPVAAMAIAVLLSGIGVALNELFVSSDVELLLTAPITDTSLFLLKLFDCAVPVWPAAGWVFASIAGFGAALRLSPVFYVATAAVTILLGLALSLIAVGGVLLLARVIPPRRLRDSVLLISGLTGLLISISVYGSRWRTFNRSTANSATSIGGRLTWTPVGWAASALTKAASGAWTGALGYGLLLLTFIATGGVVCSMLFTHVFLAGWSASHEVTGGRRRAVGPRPQEAERSVAWSIACKDWLTLRRDTPYLSSLVPSLLYSIVYPFLLLRFGTGGSLAGRWLGIAGLPLVPVLAASSFALTAISREGTAFNVLRGTPASSSRILAGKTLAVAVPLAAMTAAAGAALAAFHNAPAAAFAVATVGGIWLGSGCSVIGVAVGALNPKFDTDFSRRRQGLSSAGCFLYAVVAGLFVAGSGLLVGAIVAVVLGRAGAVAVPLVAAACCLFLAGVAALAIVTVIANLRLRRLLGPED